MASNRQQRLAIIHKTRIQRTATERNAHSLHTRIFPGFVDASIRTAAAAAAAIERRTLKKNALAVAVVRVLSSPQHLQTPSFMDDSEEFRSIIVLREYVLVCRSPDPLKWS